MRQEGALRGAWDRWAAGTAGLLGIFAASFFVYRGALAGFFVQDDYDWLVQSRFNHAAEFLRCYFRFNSSANYRPLSQETFFWLGQHLFGLHPAGYHVVSFVVFFLAALILYRLIRLFFPRGPALAGTFFFAVHGAHFRSIYWISAIPEPMALLFYLAALFAFLQFDRLGSRAAYFISLLAMLFGVCSKESILSLPLVLAAYCLIFARRRILWTAPFFFISAGYALLRLTSKAVGVSPYPLAFDASILKNLAAYFSWACGFNQQVLLYRWGFDLQRGYALTGACFFILLLVLLRLSGNRRAAIFALAWFLIALQPVLYFKENVDTYYLAPALAGISFLIAGFLASRSGPATAAAIKGISAAVFFAWVLWASHYRVREEGRWWNERAETGRRILDRMKAVAEDSRNCGRVMIFGFSVDDYGLMMGGSAFHCFGFPWSRYILWGIAGAPDQVRHIARFKEIDNYGCYVYGNGEFTEWTREFRQDPEIFISPAGPPRVGLKANSDTLIRGKDTLRLEVVNLRAPAIDLKYDIEGKAMPDIEDWKLADDGAVSVPISESTVPGEYHLRAVRDSRRKKDLAWHWVEARVTIR